MRTFEHFPEDIPCVICRKSDDKKCTLLPVDGTEDGNNCEAIPVHADCVRNLEFRYNRGVGIIYRYL